MASKKSLTNEEEQEAPGERLTRESFPEVLDQVLDDANQRVWRAKAILELATTAAMDLLGGPLVGPEQAEVNRIMLAMEAAAAQLENIADLIGCNTALANACNALIAKDAAVSNG